MCCCRLPNSSGSSSGSGCGTRSRPPSARAFGSGVRSRSAMRRWTRRSWWSQPRPRRCAQSLHVISRTPHADEETCRRFYRTHLGRFRSPDLIEARHILFVAKPDDPEALAGARTKAQNVIDLLKQRPDRFSELAEELSACPSSKQGGSLGQLTRGRTVPELETFLFELEPGQLCQVPARGRY